MICYLNRFKIRQYERVRSMGPLSSEICKTIQGNTGMFKLNKKSISVLAIISLFLLAAACSSVVNESSTSPTSSDDSDWLIPSDQVYVGSGRDEIASIDDPDFSNVSDIDFLEDEDLVIGIKIDGQVKGYPHKVLNYHEIVNDQVADTPVSVTFCPLTGSALAWNRTVEGEVTTFGVSGFIHRNNLIAYDRKTESFWSQMLNLSVKGPMKGESRKTYQLIETTWSAWKAAFPESFVLTGNTGYDWNYLTNPYGNNYPNDDNNIVFPIEREDDRLERKTLAHGLFYNSSLHIFPIKEFPDEIKVINRIIAGTNVVVLGSAKHELVIAFSRKLDDGTLLTFRETSKQLPVIMEDDEGTIWNIFGEAVEGLRKGTTLNSVPSYNAYWFAWADFFGSNPKDPKIVTP